MSAPDDAHEARERIDLTGGLYFKLVPVFRPDGYALIGPDGASLGPQWWKGDDARAFAAAMQAREARIAELEAALNWYADQAAGCRKLGSIGDPYRQALDADGGSRARAALARYRAALANTGEGQ